jgi:UDP-2,3-diacylglucosamine pyrophosphatase LpxH
MTSAQLARPTRKQRVRTLWVSDVHLGTRDCQAEHLAAFLKRYHADKVYLVGDIIDGWKLRSGIYWPQAHTNVLRRLLTMSKRGTEVIYVTGNHDEFLRRYSSLLLGNSSAHSAQGKLISPRPLSWPKKAPLKGQS